MMKRLTTGFLILTLCGATGASAQEGARARARQALPDAVFSEISGVAQRLDQEGVPGELLFNKALEGVAKGVPADRLLPALELYAGRLGEARAALGGPLEVPLIVAGADAIQRGVHADALRSLGENEGRSPVSVLVLADLVETGVPTDRALDLVRDALRSRTQEQQMLDLSERVRRLMRDGMTARDAVEQVRRAMDRRRGSDLTSPVPPQSEPLTTDRLRRMDRRSGSG